MLTVKYQDVDGTEMVFPVYEASYDPRMGSSGSPSHRGCQGEVRFHHPSRPNAQKDDDLYRFGGTLVSVCRGVVYLMNDAGKTVAKYDLGGQKLPCGESPPGGTVTLTRGDASSTVFTGAVGYDG